MARRYDLGGVRLAWASAQPAGRLHVDGVTELLLELTYTGDVARAYVDGELVADHFWYGPPWLLDLTRFAPAVVEHGLEIRILRKPEGSAVYVDPSVRTRYKAALDTAVLENARLPVRRVSASDTVRRRTVPRGHTFRGAASSAGQRTGVPATGWRA